MPDNVIFEPDLDYTSGIGGKVQLDIVRPRDNSGSPHPAVLCIHGGGFRAGNRESYLPLCIRLAQRGYVAATVTYRLAPVFQFPDRVVRRESRRPISARQRRSASRSIPIASA